MDATIETFNKIAPQYVELTFDKISQFELNEFISMVPKEAKVLDVGCGSGRDLHYLMDYKFDVVGIDLSEGIINEAKKRVPKGNFQIMDMRGMEFEDNTFDGIWCCVTLCNIKREDLQRTLKEFKRILKPRGVLYISVKEGEGERVINDEKYNNLPLHFTFYQKDEIENALKKENFNIIKNYASEGEDANWMNIFTKASS